MKKNIPDDIKHFAMCHITSHPNNHASKKAFSAWINKERKKFAYEIMDLFDKLGSAQNNVTDVKNKLGKTNV